MINEKLTWAIGAWCDELAAALEFLTGSKPAVTWSPRTATSSSSSGDHWVEQKFAGGFANPLWLSAPDETWRGIATQVLEAAGVTGADEKSIRTTWLEILSQTAAGFARQAGERSGISVETLAPAIDASPSPGGHAFLIEIRIGETAFTSGVVLGREHDDKDKRAEIDLLLDIELPLSVSFGKTFMPLCDVLKLTTGSIVELDRLVMDPVDLVVNNCVIARGEVVVVEGNYGVRITDVISRESRLRVGA